MLLEDVGISKWNNHKTIEMLEEFVVNVYADPKHVVHVAWFPGGHPMEH